MSDLRDTQFGFVWGPVRVERTTEMPQGHHVVNVNGVDIYVSRTGRSVRVFRAGQELKPAAKP